ncbi:MAG TPA: DNA polymerase III subunit delta' [Thermodesulfovibrionales bacterium]|nr:DNA polymerase III subunit delta' [Thermodesulfovibrionales bacterium]
MAIEEIIGQEKTVGILLGILRRERIASSYLFSGETGIGKKTTALNFAKAVNCLNNGSGVDNQQDFLLPAGRIADAASLDACDICESCRKIDAGAHPDVVLISPEERLIRIDEIRTIEEALSFRPYEGRKKVVIVDDADTMNQQAANTFLKTLEEPPEDSLIILISSQPDKLLPTIRSRCSAIAFHPLSLDSCRRILKGKIADKDIEQAVRLSLGRPGLALTTDIREERDWFINLLKAMLRSEKDSWASRDEVDRWFEHALLFMRDLAVLSITGRQSLLINEDLAENLERLGKSVGLQGIIDIHKELGFVKSMLLFNLNKSLTWNYTSALLRKELVL